MRVHNKIGSKERFLEMFQNVNKMNVVDKTTKEKIIKEEYDQWGRLKKHNRVNEEVDESFDNPIEKDHEYLNKGNITNVLKQTKPDDGVRYPVEKPLKVKDASLEKMKGDDAPIVEFEDDQEVADFDSEESDDEFQNNQPTPNNDGVEMGNDIEDALSGEEESEPDDNGFDNIEVSNNLEGGKGDDATPSEFDPLQISKGIKVEMEHTKDPSEALEIVLDHLTEDPKYYGDGGVDPEAAAMVGAQNDVHDSSYGDETPEYDDMEAMLQGIMGDEEAPEGDEESEILFGKMDTVGKNGRDEMPDDLDFEFKPKNVGEDFDFAGQERDYYDNKYEEDDEARKEELINKGEMASPEEKEELSQLLGLGQEDELGKIQPSGSV